MKTRNAMQLKALIKSRSIEIGLTPQQALHADYLNNFVLKGGYLISNLIGFGSRTTMDVDSTIKNLPIEETVMAKAFTHICGVQVEDDFTFTPIFTALAIGLLLFGLSMILSSALWERRSE